MNFKLKTQSELAAMTEKEVIDYQMELEKNRFEATQQLIEKSKDGLATKEELKAIEKSILDFTDVIAKLSKPDEVLSREVELHKAIEENFEEIEKAVKSGGKFTIELKAPATVTTRVGSLTASLPAMVGMQIAPPTNVNLRVLPFKSLVNNMPTNQASYAYTETVPKDGDYEFVAEGALKPQIDFKVETRFANPKTVAAWIKLTRQAVYDVANLQAIAQDLLRKKHDIFVNKAILKGDGLGENIKGMTGYGRVFSAGAMATKVKNPNIANIIGACVVDIATTHNYEEETPYVANLAFINPMDYFTYVNAAKDANDLPLFPNASQFGSFQIGNVTLISDEAIPEGKILVCDASKYNTTDYEGYNVTIGLVNDDLIYNQFVILGESRMHAFVKKLDERAFIYDDIATIETAIKKA